LELDLPVSKGDFIPVQCSAFELGLKGPLRDMPLHANLQVFFPYLQSITFLWALWSGIAHAKTSDVNAGSTSL